MGTPRKRAEREAGLGRGSSCKGSAGKPGPAGSIPPTPAGQQEDLPTAGRPQRHVGMGDAGPCAGPARSHLACRKEAPGCAPWPPAAPGCCRLRTAASMAALPPAGPSASLSRVTERLRWPGGSDQCDARGRARAGRQASAEPQARAETGSGGGAGGGGKGREGPRGTRAPGRRGEPCEGIQGRGDLSVRGE